MSGIRYPNDIWFHSLFNNLTGAYALQHFGETCQRPDWSRRAATIRKLILSAPVDRGVFPTIAHSEVRYARRETRWIPSSHWMLTDGMGEACVTFQRHNVSKVIDWEHLYNTTQCSYTANVLLRGHREMQPDPRAVRFCTEYGEFLVTRQGKNGAIPTFFEVGTLRPDQVMPLGAETACSAMFLAHLYIATREERFLRAAQNAEAFVAQNVIRSNKWQDHETYFDSCGKPIGFWDSHTGQYAQATQCISWAGEMYRLLAEATGEDAYLDKGCAVLDYLALFQQIWQAPFRSVPTFGGFAVGNGHAAWNDARQGLFSPIFVKYAEATGEEEYLLRGIAAARAGLWLMFVPENAQVSPHMFDKGPIGHADENYAHRGEDRPALVGYCFDYQVGGTLAALGYLQRTHGDVHVSLKRQTAYAINALDVSDVSARDDSLSLTVRRRSSATTRVRITVGDATRPAYRVIVNGSDRGILSGRELQRGVDFAWSGDAELWTLQTTATAQS
jgi:hypothetical protein